MSDIVKTDLKSLGDYGSHYSHAQHCTNCREKNVVFVKKGHPLNGLSTTCTKCGCTVRLAP